METQIDETEAGSINPRLLRTSAQIAIDDRKAAEAQGRAMRQEDQAKRRQAPIPANQSKSDRIGSTRPAPPAEQSEPLKPLPKIDSAAEFWMAKGKRTPQWLLDQITDSLKQAVLLERKLENFRKIAQQKTAVVHDLKRRQLESESVTDLLERASLLNNLERALTLAETEEADAENDERILQEQLADLFGSMSDLSAEIHDKIESAHVEELIALTQKALGKVLGSYDERLLHPLVYSSEAFPNVRPFDVLKALARSSSRLREHNGNAIATPPKNDSRSWAKTVDQLKAAVEAKSPS
jgi:hypothetical protein